MVEFPDEQLKNKALRVIEAMASVQEPESGILASIASIYRIAHVGLGECLGECKGAHDDWAQELESLYERLVLVNDRLLANDWMFRVALNVEEE